MLSKVSLDSYDASNKNMFSSNLNQSEDEDGYGQMRSHRNINESSLSSPRESNRNQVTTLCSSNTEGIKVTPEMVV